MNFDTTHFVLAHGVEPRGYGAWAFDVYVNGKKVNARLHAGDVNADEPVWAPASTYGDAKKWIRAAALARGCARSTTTIVVLS
jgi:hypothetical protein